MAKIKIFVEYNLLILIRVSIKYKNYEKIYL